MRGKGCLVYHGSHPPRTCMPMRPPLRLSTSLAVVALLSACAASYVPSTDPNATKVRVRNQSGGLLSSVMVYTRPVGASSCGTRVSSPQLWPYGDLTPPAPVGPTPQPPPPPRTYPRVGMAGATDGTRTDNAELLIAPGRHQFEFHASVPGYCRLDAFVDLEAGRQVELNFAIDGSTRRCTVTARRLEGQAWQAMALAPKQTCPA